MAALIVPSSSSGHPRHYLFLVIRTSFVLQTCSVVAYILNRSAAPLPTNSDVIEILFPEHATRPHHAVVPVRNDAAGDAAGTQRPAIRPPPSGGGGAVTNVF